MAIVDALIPIARKAGHAILPFFQQSHLQNISIKADNSPVTAADNASHEVIHSQLKQQFPDIPQLSEEGNHLNYDGRQHWTRYFLIDPLDGTKEFIKGNPEYTVNIAYLEHNSLIASVVYAPSTNELYFASKGEGAYKQLPDGTNKALQCKEITEPNSITVVTSKSHFSDETQQHLSKLEQHLTVQYKRYGSSLKMCKIAEGEADYYPRLGPTMEWDTAAAQLIVQEAGAELVKAENYLSLTYNKKQLINPHFFCASKTLLHTIKALSI